MDILESERRALAGKLDKILKVQSGLRRDFLMLPDIYKNDPNLLNIMLTSYHNRLARLENTLQKPYFARMDYLEDGSAEKNIFYIGKIGVESDDRETVVLDWRAPVSTLYYDGNLGEVTYDSPGGECRGRLELKRMIEIEDGRLVSCTDVDTVSDDELLRPYLATGADERLKNIISTIQKEQNEIIRLPITKNTLVRGSAGSGKTTVALHRVAYLAYTHREKIAPDKYLVLGPNKLFAKYIAGVLPDLDVDDVPQHSYESFVKFALGESYGVVNLEYQNINDPGSAAARIAGIKSSEAYRRAIDAFLSDYEEDLMPDGDFFLHGFKVLEHCEIIREWKRAREGVGSSVKARAAQCVLYLSTRIKSRPELGKRLDEHYRLLYRAPEVSLDRLNRDRAASEREIENGCAASLTKFIMKKANIKITELYKLFIKSADNYLEQTNGISVSEFKKQSLKYLNKRQALPEDLPAYLYLKSKMGGTAETNPLGFRHCVADEVQDYGSFHMTALVRALGGCTLTAVGDPVQSIHTYRAVCDWEEFSRSFDKPPESKSLFKSYRNTVQITKVAARITKRLGVDSPVPTIREGSEPVFEELVPQSLGSRVASEIKRHLAAGHKSVAVLSKSPELTEHTAKEAAPFLEGVESDILIKEDATYRSGVVFMPAALCKGLEFDSVIVTDASDALFCERADAHLLYVMLTRPLHELTVFHTGEISRFLAK